MERPERNGDTDGDSGPEKAAVHPREERDGAARGPVREGDWAVLNRPKPEPPTSP